MKKIIDKTLVKYPMFRKSALIWWSNNPNKKANSSFFSQSWATLETRRDCAELLNCKRLISLSKKLKEKDIR